MSAKDRYIVGVDLGGTNIVAGAMPIDGSREIAMQTTPTLADTGAEAVADRIAGMIEQVIAQTISEAGANRSDFIGVGIGAPGPLNRAKGIVIVTPNLGWKNFPLRDEISRRVSLDATLDNDANCATLGEFWCGAAVGGTNVIGITLEGKLYHGSSDVAGEIGHTSIDANGRRCKCGNYGCLEAYASGPAIAERAREALRGDEGESILISMVDGDQRKITAQTVYEASKRGDATAREVVRETARILGTGVANLLNIFNPDIVVLAGGVTQAGDALFQPLRAEVRRRAFKPAVQACKIVPGALPLSAGVVGAIATFKQQKLGEL